MDGGAWFCYCMQTRHTRMDISFSFYWLPHYCRERGDYVCVAPNKYGNPCTSPAHQLIDE